MEPEIVEKKIKPSSRKPDHRPRYELSFLDKISPPVYNPLILFFRTNKGDTKLSEQLKESLSEALTHCYPLAGRIRDNSFVDCNDEGIPFVEKQFKHCELPKVNEPPEPDELRKLLPFELDQAEEVPARIQFNIFACGGIAVGVCISHKLGDALATFTFVNYWAAVSGKKPRLVPPEFISAKPFPATISSGFNPRIGITNENIKTRLVFRTSDIDGKIIPQYGKGPGLDNQQPPSRVEALSVFIWNRFVAATRAPAERVNCILHAVNLRARMNPPPPSFGNCYGVVRTFPSTGDDGSVIVKKMRDSESSIVERLQDHKGYIKFLKEESEKFTNGEVEYLNFTSLCGFPLYDADFGWGKPFWVGTPSLTFGNLVVFTDTASGDGIEALIHLKKKVMDKFQKDEELLKYTARQ